MLHYIDNIIVVRNSDSITFFKNNSILKIKRTSIKDKLYIKQNDTLILHFSVRSI